MKDLPEYFVSLSVSKGYPIAIRNTKYLTNTVV